MNSLIFSIYLVLPAALGLRVYSASNRNEYQKQKQKAFNLLNVYNYIALSSRKQAEVKLIRMNMFTAYNKVKPDAKNTGGINLTAVELRTVKVTDLLM
jgi:hypothetical protein